MSESVNVGIPTVNSIEFIEEVLRCQRDGQVVVPLRSVDDVQRRTAADVGRVVVPGNTHGFMRCSDAPLVEDRVAQILFTSGTTGEPRAIALTGGNLNSTTRRLNQVMGLTGEIREYVGVPVYYSFGMGRVRAVGDVGGEIYLPPDGFNPAEIASMLKRGEINAISAVPTLWRLLIQHADLVARNGAGVRWIEIGSQPMSRVEKEQLKQLFPNAVIVQHYGLTEASRTTFLSVHETDGRALESVGRAHSPVELRVREDSRILIRGPHVAKLYRPGQSPASLADHDGWLVTNDTGHLENGLLYFLGRVDDLVNCGGVKIASEEFERALQARLRIAEGIAVGRRADALRGEGLIVAFTANTKLTEANVRATAVAVAESFGIKGAGAISVRCVAALPVTETGKVRRNALDQALAGEAMVDAQAVSQLRSPVDGEHDESHQSLLQKRLLEIWREALGIEDIAITDSFYDLGGDSLTAMTVAVRMEKAGLAREIARGVFAGKTVAQLAAELSNQRDLTESHESTAKVTALQARLLGVWREALGIEDIGLDDNFYDLGGDSLTAMTVAVRMEKAGVPREIARGVFSGKSIGELAAEHPPQQDSSSSPVVEAVKATARTAPQSVSGYVVGLNEALNFIRGMVIFAMVCSHWVPPLMRETALGARYGYLLSPFFSMGSPTLAIIFGVGVSIFNRRQFAKSRSAFLASVRSGAMLLLFGVSVHVVSEAAVGYARGVAVSWAELALLGYGPLIYYLVATVSLPSWIGHVRDSVNSAYRFAWTFLALYFAYVVCLRYLPSRVPSPLSQLGLELIIGKWGLLQMGALSALGVAGGISLERQLQRDSDLGQTLRPGLMLVAFGVLLSGAAGQVRLWFAFPKSSDLWSILSYAGVMLATVGAYGRYWTRLRRITFLRRVFEVVCCCGVLLFPFFVLQSIVYQGSVVLAAKTDLSANHALLLCIAGFLAVAQYAVRRVYTLYYQWSVRV